jgi:exonuclease III
MAEAFSILSWNVQGLNSPAKRKVVHDLVWSSKPTLLYLQETKMIVISRTMACEILGQRLAGFHYLLANNTRGGILVGWNEELTEATNFIPKEHYLSMNIIVRETNSAFFMAMIYGPSEDIGKLTFLQEL